MYKLTIDFKTLEELKAFSEKLSGTPITVSAPVEAKDDEVKEAPAPKKAPAKKAAEVKAPVEAPAPVATPVQGPSKAEMVAHATELVNKLRQAVADGLFEESQLMPTINQAFTTAGIPLGQKIGALDEASLAKFMPIFESTVVAVISSPHSFI